VNKIYRKERLMRIMEIARRDSRVIVDSLATVFGVTPATIRSDLNELAQRGLMTRTHGGALLAESLDDILRQDRDPTYDRRVRSHPGLKEAIGRAAAGLLADGDSITLDDGSTTLQVARCLPSDKQIHVLTNGLNICLELVNNPNVAVIATGGSVNPKDLSFSGRVAQEIAGRFYSNKAILGASGVSVKYGVTTPTEEKAELKKAMIEHCHQLIIVADHTKLDRVTRVPVCPLSRVGILVTDRQAPPDIVEEFRNHGVRVLLA